MIAVQLKIADYTIFTRQPGKLTGSALFFLSSVLGFRDNDRQAVGELSHGGFQLTQPAFDLMQVLLIRSAARFKNGVAAEVRNTACSGFVGSTL
jgi:hypothetical protein